MLLDEELELLLVELDSLNTELLEDESKLLEELELLELLEDELKGAHDNAIRVGYAYVVPSHVTLPVSPLELISDSVIAPAASDCPRATRLERELSLYMRICCVEPRRSSPTYKVQLSELSSVNPDNTQFEKLIHASPSQYGFVQHCEELELSDVELNDELLDESTELLLEELLMSIQCNVAVVAK